MSNDEDLGPGVPFRTKTYICVHVYEGSHPALYVTRPMGDWCVLCGDEHPQEAGQYVVGGLGHVIETDPTLAEVLDLDENEEAERSVVGGAWARTYFDPGPEG